jgi:probable HAF family extracellular repeat protein
LTPADFDAGADCGPGTGDDFTVTYYNNDTLAGLTPGSLRASHAVTLTDKFLTGCLLVDLFEEWQFAASHPPVPVTAGECLWVSITNNTTGSCFWLWSTSPDGDGRSSQAVPYPAWGQTDYDLTFCVDVSIEPVPGCVQQLYELIDLGTLGGSSSKANGISENGLVAGWSLHPLSGKHAVIWDRNGEIVDIGAPPGYAGEAEAVNVTGQAACYGEDSPQAYQGYFWENNVWTPIGMLPGHFESIARDINSAGQVVGSSFVLGGVHRAVRWDAGVLTDLGTLGEWSGTRERNCRAASTRTAVSYGRMGK